MQPEKYLQEFANYRMRPEEIDPDVMQFFESNWQKIDEEKDARLIELSCILAECYSQQSVTTALMQKESFDLIALHLPIIQRLSYHFPLQNISIKNLTTPNEPIRFGNVRRQALKLIHTMINTLLSLCPSNTDVVIVSSHGIRKSLNQPILGVKSEQEQWERNKTNGIIILQGPLWKEDEIIATVSIVDIAPTILQVAGLPLNEKISGNVIKNAWVDNIETSREPAKEIQSDAIKLNGENETWWLIKSLLEDNAYLQALPLLTVWHQNHPEDFDALFLLAQLQLRVGNFKDSESNAKLLLNNLTKTVQAKFLLGKIFYESKRYLESYELLKEAREANEDNEMILCQIGLVQTEMGINKQAFESFKKALETNERSGFARIGIGHCLIKDNEFEDAVIWLKEGIKLVPDFHLAHLNLASAYEGLEKWGFAINSLERALQLKPIFSAEIHVKLAILLKRNSASEEKINFHVAEAEKCRIEEAISVSQLN